MNEINYASLEASKRLVDAGIVLETDFKWHQQTDGSFMLVESSWPTWELAYPALSMAEVWRELPNVEIIKEEGITKARLLIFNSSFRAYASPEFENLNSTDALIDLLIWVKGKEAKP